MVNREICAFGAKEGEFLQAFIQNKANFRKGQINISIFSTKDYEKIAHLETPAKQSQTKPISSVRASEIRPEEVRFQAEKSDLLSLL